MVKLFAEVAAVEIYFGILVLAVVIYSVNLFCQYKFKIHNTPMTISQNHIMSPYSKPILPFRHIYSLSLIIKIYYNSN
jgi:hypothetical protein